MHSVMTADTIHMNFLRRKYVALCKQQIDQIIIEKNGRKRISDALRVCEWGNELPTPLSSRSSKV